MASELDMQLSHVGYAKVIVALKREMALGRPVAAEEELANHFVTPDEQQAIRLAAVAATAASKSFRRRQSVSQRKLRVYPHLGLALGYINREGATSLAADNRVQAVVLAPELSLIRPISTSSAVKKSPAPTWGITRLHVPELWAAGITGKGVLIGHLDTGIDATHPALTSAIDEFAELDLAGDRVPGAKPHDSDTTTPAHGTHTAGTIAGRPTPQRIIGVAPDAMLASGMVIEGGQVIDRILAGIDWILSKGARILSMSLGLRGFTPAFQAITDALRTNNVLPVFAVGNEGPGTSRSPGNYANVVSIGAMDIHDLVADFSSSQTFHRPQDPLVPDLVAPGVDVMSSAPNKGFVTMSGTSMATPHIAGLAALLLQAKPTATANELEAAILFSCKLPQGMFQERGNRGVPDAVAAFTKLTGQPPAATTSAQLPRHAAARRKAKATSKRVAAGGRRRHAAPRRRKAR